MPANPNPRRNPMRDSPPSGILQLLIQHIDGHSSANSYYACIVVHAEVLEIDHIDREDAVDATETVVSIYDQLSTPSRYSPGFQSRYTSLPIGKACR